MKDTEITAGKFSSWLRRILESLETGEGMDVECGDCRACCTSSLFIRIEPDETDALSSIPGELLFPAPLFPKGNMVMGYDEKGHCPMFRDNACSVYRDRPRICRKYDCRILAATGFREDDARKLINMQADRWRFDIEDEEDRESLEAVNRAARFISDNEKDFPSGFVSHNPVQRAVLAIRAYGMFYGPDSGDTPASDRMIIMERIVRDYGEPATRLRQKEKDSNTDKHR